MFCLFRLIVVVVVVAVAVVVQIPISNLKRVFQLDERSYYANYFMAFTLETVGNRPEAIKYREALLALDPWGSDGQIELIKDYLAAGDKESAQKIKALINRNYPGSQADVDASALLVG